MITGWDIGGVNTKVARVSGGAVLAVHSRPFEIQRDRHALTDVLRGLAAEVGAEPGDAHAVTMTAELSQAFRTKREGVAFVLDAVEAAFAWEGSSAGPRAPVLVFTTAGTFIDTQAAREQPLAVAAANWMATAMIVARHHPEALLIDTGSTTTDIIPIEGGAVAAVGKTDPERLASGELVYRGVVRTPVEAVGAVVPWGEGLVRVSAEGFALSGDVFVWLGDLLGEEYTAPTPDGRPPTREFAGERLARVVCADREMIDATGITGIAEALGRSLVHDIRWGLSQVTARHPLVSTAVVTGLGAFVAERAARDHGLGVVHLSATLGDAAARSAPAAAVALLLDGQR